jgi:predicted Rossmann-fold nucleotide-binding protein
MIFSHISIEDAAIQLQHQIKLVRAIKQDRKPIIYAASPAGRTLAAQIQRLWERGMLADMPSAYYSFADNEQAATDISSDMHEKFGFNPVPANFLYRIASRQETLTDEVEGVLFAGMTPPFTPAGAEREAWIRHASVVIALPGDLEAYEDLAWLLREKIRGRLHHVPLIIENSRKSYEPEEGYWGQVLQTAFGLEHVTTALLQEPEYADALAKMGVFISAYWDQTRQFAIRLGAEHPAEMPDVALENATVADGTVIFLATRTKRKLEDIRAIYHTNHLHVDVRMIDDLVDPFVSPDEKSGTYEGNTYEKLHAAAKAWANMPPNARKEQLEYLGLRVDQVLIMAEDSGFFLLEPGLRDEEEFRNIEHLRGKTFPGVDTAPILHAMHGSAHFFAHLGDIRDRREAAAKAAGNERYSFNDKAYSQSIFGVVRMSDIERNLAIYEHDTTQPRIALRPEQVYMVRGGKRVRFVTRPQPDDGAGAELDNFLIPIGHGFDGVSTEAELGASYVTTLTARARSLLALCSQIGVIPDRVISQATGFSEHFRVGFVTDAHNNQARKLAVKLERETSREDFSVLALPEVPADSQSDGFTLRKAMQHAANDGRSTVLIRKIEEANAPQAAYLSKADAIIFAPDPKRAHEDYWENLFTFTSFVVGEQIADRYKLDKPLYLVNPKGAFDWLEHLVLRMHELGTIPEKPSRLYTTLHSLKEIETRALPELEQFRKEYRPYRPPYYATQQNPNPIQGQELDTDFNVGIFCSASTENRAYLNTARDLAERMMQQGFGIVHGAGSRSMMGVLVEVAASHGGQQAGSTSPPMLDREGNATHLMSASGGRYQFLLARDIYERMEFMINTSDAFVIMVGGAGTVQELSLLGLLKKRALEESNLYAQKLMQHKDIIIINSWISDEDGGFYDALIESIPEGDLELLGIHVVENATRATELLSQLRARKEKRVAKGERMEHLPLLTFERKVLA